MFEYNIYRSVYDDMFSGKKTIEFRLLNDKSNSIKSGDMIKFKVIDEEKYLLVKVIDKHIFDNLDELWENRDAISNNTLDYSKDEFIELFYQIFGKEKVDNSKIVGIKFELN